MWGLKWSSFTEGQHGGVVVWKGSGTSKLCAFAHPYFSVEGALQLLDRGRMSKGIDWQKHGTGRLDGSASKLGSESHRGPWEWGGKWDLPVPLFLKEFPSYSVPLRYTLSLVNNSLPYVPRAFQNYCFYAVSLWAVYCIVPLKTGTQFPLTFLALPELSLLIFFFNSTFKSCWL